MTTRTFVLMKDPFSGRESLIGDDGMHLANVHPDTQCAGTVCTLHNPTQHHMRDWPMHWRGDRKIFERICDHGVGHPDPDQEEYLINFEDDLTHGCDGCCSEVSAR
jgi:hypothetical protein